MASLTELVGEKLLKGENEEVDVTTLSGNGKVLGIYFSAHWCPPCRAFTPQLKKWYETVKAGPNGSNFDIVFVSSDRDENSMKEYFADMPWHALDYSNRKKKDELSRKFKVTGIPTLVFVNADDSKLITAEGRNIVMEDPEGKEFPWTPKPFSEIIRGKFVNKAGEESQWEDLDGKVVGLYFSAHWCGPCRAFTPQLAKTYQKLKEDGKNFEIIFCSSDRDETTMKEYLGGMPWLAIPFGDRRKKALSTLYGVSGIPTLVLLDQDRKVITTSGRAAIAQDPDGKEFPWFPKPLNELSGHTASAINETPSLIWFTDATEAKMDEAKALFYPIAEKYNTTWKEADEDPKMMFFYAGENDDEDLVSSLRQFANLPKRVPLLAIIDIPEQKKYVSDVTDKVTAENLTSFIEDFLTQAIAGDSLK